MGKGIDDSKKSDSKLDALLGDDPGPQGAAAVALQSTVEALEARIAALEAKAGINQ